MEMKKLMEKREEKMHSCRGIEWEMACKFWNEKYGTNH
jgi:hypothetical protein